MINDWDVERLHPNVTPKRVALEPKHQREVATSGMVEE